MGPFSALGLRRAGLNEYRIRYFRAVVNAPVTLELDTLAFLLFTILNHGGEDGRESGIGLTGR